MLHMLEKLDNSRQGENNHKNDWSNDESNLLGEDEINSFNDDSAQDNKDSCQSTR